MFEQLCIFYVVYGVLAWQTFLMFCLFKSYMSKLLNNGTRALVQEINVFTRDISVITLHIIHTETHIFTFQCHKVSRILINWAVSYHFYRCTVHSDIHTAHSPTDAHLLELWLKFTLKLDGSYMFRSTTIFRELAVEPG